jgi:hypothetical protein
MFLLGKNKSSVRMNGAFFAPLKNVHLIQQNYFLAAHTRVGKKFLTVTRISIFYSLLISKTPCLLIRMESLTTHTQVWKNGVDLKERQRRD